MKKVFSSVSAFLVALTFAACYGKEYVSAATKEDVIAAARAAGFSESYVQQGINYLESGSYTPEQYDKMVAIINSYSGRTEEAIRDYLGGSSNPDPVPPEENIENNSPSVTESENIPEASPDTPVQDNNETNSDTQQQNNPSVVPEKDKVDFSSMTEEEKDDYIAGLSTEEKNQIIKDLDRETQLEIIDSLIDASSSLGLNVSVDNLTKDKIEYSIRDNEGGIVDISSMGVIVDDTGIDYTILILCALTLILLSAGGIMASAVYMNRKSTERKN